MQLTKKSQVCTLKLVASISDRVSEIAETVILIYLIADIITPVVI